MPFGTEVDLGPGDIVLDGDPQKGGTGPPILAHVLWPNGCMDQEAIWYEGRPWPRHNVLHGDPAPPQKGGGTAATNFRPMSVVAKRLDGSMPLGTEVGLCTGIVLDGDPAPLKRGKAPPLFGPLSTVAKRSPIAATAELLYNIVQHSS